MKKAKQDKNKVPKGEMGQAKEEGKEKSFARRARPSSNPASMAKWDAIRDAFNKEIRELAAPQVSAYEACVSFGVCHGLSIFLFSFVPIFWSEV